MPETNWWIKDRTRAAKEGKKRHEFFKTGLSNILVEWNDNSPSSTGIKFIKIKRGKIELEFALYHLERFKRGMRRIDSKVMVICDRYDLVISQVHLKSPTPNKMLDKIFKKYKITKRLHELEDTYDLDTINEILMEIDELMEMYEEYELMDILVRDI